MKQLIKSFGFFLSVCWDTFKVFYGKSKFYRNYGVVSVQFLTRNQVTEMYDRERDWLTEMAAQLQSNQPLGKDKEDLLN